MRVALYRGMPWYVGGSLQYEVTILDALAALAPRRPEEFVCITYVEDNLRSMAASGKMTYSGLPVQFLSEQKFQQPPPEAYLNQPPPPPPAPSSLPNPDHLFVNPVTHKMFRENRFDWVFQLLFDPIGFSSLMPFVMPIHDLQHREQPEFPEVSENGEIQRREYLFRNACRFATLIVTESEVGKEDVLRFYGDYVTEDRIRVLTPFPPTRPVRVVTQADRDALTAKHNLPPRFFFYPAQFWQHKNHAAIIHAIKIVADATGDRLPVVFVGSYAGQHRAEVFTKAMTLAENLGVRDLVHYLGFVPDAEIDVLYSMAVSLVMPTFFGPSNLPPLEAWRYGCPVITSDIRGIREQTGDAGLLADPRQPLKWGEMMLTLWRRDDYRQELIARGRRRIDAYSWSDYVGGVEAIVEETSTRLREGRTPCYPTPRNTPSPG